MFSYSDLFERHGGKGRVLVLDRVLDIKGQSTVEAAFVIPVLFILLLMLIQPGILLYNHMVMASAASEGCRVLCTKTDTQGSSNEACEAYIRRRLESIPPQDNFHIHDDGCSWEIQLIGNEGTEEVTVEIKNSVQLLPLLDIGGVLLGFADAAGIYTQTVTVSTPTQPAWVQNNDLGMNPDAWVDQWK